MSQTLYRVLSLGELKAGKTCAITTFYNPAKFTTAYNPTNGVGQQLVQLTVSSVKVTLQFWDASGNRALIDGTKTYYDDCELCMLVFDASNLATLDSLDFWYNSFMDYLKGSRKTDFPFALVATKIDSASAGSDYKSRAASWAQARGGMPVYEISARDAINLQSTLEGLTNQLLKRYYAK
eukprot:TRINITY_DN4521_c0_g1_i1.p1 TRINITY_DN4521_c0_g1~~TRINITY_DN4521_c0_g1_i1.p1  ORF type:complete len:180 (-),score=47.15 TRINITY_DN4521_c0_g1_i1:202-741(-)